MENPAWRANHAGDIKEQAMTKKPKATVREKNNSVKPVPADQIDPGFKFRWPTEYDFAKYSHTRAFSRMPIGILCRDAESDMRPGVWADLSLSAKAVLIVLLRYANRQGTAFPSEEMLCAKTGINSRKTVRGACINLQAAGLIEIQKYITMTGQRAKRYVLDPSRLSQTEENYLPSYHHFVEAGYWASIGYQRRHTAHALYWAMRLFAKPRPDMDEDMGWVDLASEEGKEWLEQRSGDVCAADPSVLCDFAGIHPRSYRDAMTALLHQKIITWIDDHPDKIFVDFKFRFHLKSSWLNGMLAIV